MKTKPAIAPILILLATLIVGPGIYRTYLANDRGVGGIGDQVR
jgi:hypothetical protein